MLTIQRARKHNDNKPVPHINEVKIMVNVKNRKDSRGYVLRTGEYERDDGRYSYSYSVDKERKTVYANTLAELRRKEKKIKRDIEDGVNPNIADSMTLNQLYDKFIQENMI